MQGTDHLNGDHHLTAMTSLALADLCRNPLQMLRLEISSGNALRPPTLPTHGLYQPSPHNLFIQNCSPAPGGAATATRAAATTCPPTATTAHAAPAAKPATTAPPMVIAPPLGARHMAGIRLGPKTP